MSGSHNAQLARKEGKFIVAAKREVFESLANDDHFLMFLGWLLARCGLTDAHDTNNGSEAFKILGRRQVAVETLAELEAVVPDIYEQVLRKRRDWQQQLKRLELTPEEKDRAERENEDD